MSTVTIRISLELQERDLAYLLIDAVGYTRFHAYGGVRVFDQLGASETRVLVRCELEYRALNEYGDSWMESLPDSEIDEVISAALAAVRRAYPC